MLALEASPKNPELINTVFRAFHTIKGVAGFLNLTPIVDLAHKVEFLLDAARNGLTRIDAGFLGLTLESCDLLSSLIDSLEGGTPPRVALYDDLSRRLDAVLAGSPTEDDAHTRASALRWRPPLWAPVDEWGRPSR